MYFDGCSTVIYVHAFLFIWRQGYWFDLFLVLGLLLLRLRRGQLEALGLAVLTGTDLLPGAGAALEVAEGLGQLEGLGDDALLLLVVADLGVPGQGEVL